MMTVGQYRLLKVAEECAEVAQRCSKQMQFGTNQIQPGQTRTNAERLRTEVMDLQVRLQNLVRAGQLEHVSSEDLADHRLENADRWDAMFQEAVANKQVWEC